VLAANTPDLVYQDLDVEVTGELDLRQPGPHFALCAGGVPNRGDICYFAVNGDTGYFNILVEKLMAEHRIHRRTLWGLLNRREAGPFNIIEGGFTHEGVAKWH
jgi:hypothetical protein